MTSDGKEIDVAKYRHIFFISRRYMKCEGAIGVKGIFIDVTFCTNVTSIYVDSFTNADKTFRFYRSRFATFVSRVIKHHATIRRVK